MKKYRRPPGPHKLWERVRFWPHFIPGHDEESFLQYMRSKTTSQETVDRLSKDMLAWVSKEIKFWPRRYTQLFVRVARRLLKEGVTEERAISISYHWCNEIRERREHPPDVSAEVAELKAYWGSTLAVGVAGKPSDYEVVVYARLAKAKLAELAPLVGKTLEERGDHERKESVSG